MRSLIAPFLIGSLFGIGLIVSEMINPSKVQNFLDLFGRWDPSLAFVMGGALMVTGAGFPLVARRAKPLAAPAFQIPTRRDIDRNLIAGSTLFGIGWGIAGLCPGPAVAVLPIAPTQAVTFFLGLAGGMLAHDWWQHIRTGSNAGPKANAA